MDFFSHLPLQKRLMIRAIWGLGAAGLSRQLTPFFIDALAQDIARGKQRGFEGYTPRGTDVLVCTYPKSGTNWMMQITQQILGRGAADFAHIHDVVPWPDRPMPSFPCTLHQDTGARVVKTHAEQQWVPYVPEAKYIVVIRDPKDVFTSSYHFARGVLSGVIEPSLSPEQWLARFASDANPLGDWAEHTASWWALRDRPNVKIFTFRQLKRGLAEAIDEICAFLGQPLTDAERGAVLERSGFLWMKANEARFAPPIPVLRGQGGVMIRRGAVGERGLVGADGLARIDALCREGLARQGCDFPYTEHFPLG